MPDKPIDDLPPHDRRRFFRTGLSRMLRPLADYLEEKLPEPLRNSIHTTGTGDAAGSSLPSFRTVLRPPGAARREREFLGQCLRSGACADVCPARAIRLMDTGDPELKGTPYIDADAQACVVCDELACMKACPSGALTLVGRLEIRIGLAVVDHDICVRSRGEDCRVCIEKCPIGTAAIRLDADGRINVIDPAMTGEGCTGCGVCQQQCPTRPERAIRVSPY